MVTRPKAGRMSLWAIDAAAVLGVLFCGAVFVWLVAVRYQQHGVDIAARQQALQNARWEFASLERTRARQAGALKQLRLELAREGHLPQSAPVEDYFQHLAGLVHRHGLSTISQSPLAPSRYPGLIEHRFSYEVTGPLPSVTRFLRDLEQSDFWADVSHFKLDRAAGPEDGPSNCAARLSLSLFSAPAVDSSVNEETT